MQAHQLRLLAFVEMAAYGFACPRRYPHVERGSKMRPMNAPDSRCRLARKPRSTSRRRLSKAFLAELRRQCRLANKADRRDNWRQYLYFPE
jgi:hypothetical protein